jgi:hypothetical protein
MISLLDHISSIMVYGALAFIIASTQLQAQQTAVQQTIVYSSKKQTLDFADLIEREFKMIGSGIDDRADMLGAVETDQAGNALSFNFRYDDEDGTPIRVEYRMVPRDTVRSDGQDIPLFAIERSEDGIPAGGGPGTVRRFRVQFLTDGGTLTTDPGQAELIRVSFTNTLPMGDLDDFFMPETNWAITLRPLNLDI